MDYRERDLAPWYSRTRTRVLCADLQRLDGQDRFDRSIRAGWRGVRIGQVDQRGLPNFRS